MRMASSALPIPLTRVQTMADEMLLKATQGDEADALQEERFVIVATVDAFGDEIFEGQTPFFNMESTSRMRLHATLRDDEAHISATIWDKAARVLCKRSAASMLELWEACDDEDGKQAFRDVLNENLSKNTNSHAA